MTPGRNEDSTKSSLSMPSTLVAPVCTKRSNHASGDLMYGSRPLATSIPISHEDMTETAITPPFFRVLVTSSTAVLATGCSVDSHNMKHVSSRTPSVVIHLAPVRICRCGVIDLREKRERP